MAKFRPAAALSRDVELLAAENEMNRMGARETCWTTSIRRLSLVIFPATHSHIMWVMLLRNFRAGTNFCFWLLVVSIVPAQQSLRAAEVASGVSTNSVVLALEGKVEVSLL